jgi:hypothetical protein
LSSGTGFFHIDRRTWKGLCDIGNINMAVSYLTIATGTDAGNCLSLWSAQAIERYTGIHNTRAASAIKELIAADYIHLAERSSRTRPKYELQPYNEGVALTEDLIWLPNALITGTANGERSPIGRIRSRGDIASLRLLIDLYHAQHLGADGGISRKVLWQEFDRKKCGERGRHIVWGFAPGNQEASNHVFGEIKDPIFWEALECLQKMGLLEIVPHLMENSSDDCEPIHGFGWDGVGEQIELELGKAADQAGRRLLGPTLLAVAEKVDGIPMFVPVWDTQPDVQMFGVFRLTYRPHTKRTAEWLRRLELKASEWIEEYEKLGSSRYERRASFLSGGVAV